MVTVMHGQVKCTSRQYTRSGGLRHAVKALLHIPSHEAAARRALARVAGLEVHLASAALCGALHARLERGHAAAVAPRRRPGNLWFQPARTGQHMCSERSLAAYLFTAKSKRLCTHVRGMHTGRHAFSKLCSNSERRVPDACWRRELPSDTGTPAFKHALAEGQVYARRAGERVGLHAERLGHLRPQAAQRHAPHNNSRRL